MYTFAYRLLTNLGAPVIRLYLVKRRREGREDKIRFSERLGQASMMRPEGRLVWCHAASVGEAASLLTLIEKLRDIYPGTHILVTTGTVSSARMLVDKLPPDVIHQYAPVDREAYVERFLNHWEPDFVLWIESELWPNMLAGIRKRGIKAVLLNGRMSEKSFKTWYRFKSWSRLLLSTFSLSLTQTAEECSRFVALGAKHVRCIGNLKYAAKPLTCDDWQLVRLRTFTTSRPMWLMASTHRGEEEVAVETHKKLKSKWPKLLTIIVPRHAVRGDEVAEKLESMKIKFARRSRGDVVMADTEVYIADTMGELGVLYRLSPIACIGGSFVPIGGHNIIEPAQLDCAVLFGPSMQNFSEMAREFLHNHAAIQVQNSNELPFIVDRLLSNPHEANKLAQNAKALADQKRNVLDQTLALLDPWLAEKPMKRAA